MTYNIDFFQGQTRPWDEYYKFFKGVRCDVCSFQEVYNTGWMEQMRSRAAIDSVNYTAIGGGGADFDSWLGTYSTGLLYKGVGQGLRSASFAGGELTRLGTLLQLGGEGNRPDITFLSVHLSSVDSDDDRQREAGVIKNWGARQALPAFVMGDFNTGDLADRGIPPAQANRADVADDNRPQTMDRLKQQYQLIQTARDRETFPDQLRSGRYTYPTDPRELDNWTMWGNTKIDHIMALRPYAKWFVLADAADDAYTGIMTDKAVSDNAAWADGTGSAKKHMSDHFPVAHRVRWIGPKIEEVGKRDLAGNLLHDYARDQAANVTDVTRRSDTAILKGAGLTFDKDSAAALLAPDKRSVYLGRNNGRTDIRTGPGRDDVLDCSSNRSDLCMDDHSIFAQVL